LQGALLDENIPVRFGALESLLTLGTDATIQNLVGNAARTDSSPAVKVYAAAGMWKMGDIFGREILMNMAQDAHWFVRAMAIHYLGELGRGPEYQRLMQQLIRETDPMAKAELVGALLKLNKYKDD
jgi:HEAT repeat protein